MKIIGRRKYVSVGDKFRSHGRTIRINGKRSTVSKGNVKVSIPTVYLTQKKYKNRTKKIVMSI